MICELIEFNEKRGDLMAIIDGGVELGFAATNEVVVFDTDKLAIDRSVIESPRFIDVRQLQSRVWQFRRASYC